MNAKQPELTIFQGAPSIHIDNNQMRAEEIEAIEDQKRRDAEVRNTAKLKTNDTDCDRISSFKLN
jgi:hypothetical protein